MTRQKELMGLYPNLRNHRTTLGWSITELLRAVEYPPSEKSVRRLESGLPIRLATVNKLFNAIMAANAGQIPNLVREQEIVVINH